LILLRAIVFNFESHLYYDTQSDIRVKTYCRLIILRASIQNFDRLDILWDTIGHPSKRLLSLEISQSFRYQLWTSQYITGFIHTSGWKVIVDLILLRASILNFERLDILRDTIGHPNKRLLSFEFAESFCFQFRASRYIMILNQTSE